MKLKLYIDSPLEIETSDKLYIQFIQNKYFMSEDNRMISYKFEISTKMPLQFKSQKDLDTVT